MSAAPPAPSASAKDGRGPPQLKPIAKGPFPDGATEEQVCEAILDVRQSDPWVRFGHLIPAYTLGVVFVLEAPPDRVKEIYDYVLNQYNGGGTWGPRVKGCSRIGRTMLYIRSFGPDGVLPDGRVTGPRDLVGELLQATGIRTAEWFQFLDQGMEPHQAGNRRLEDYCRADAYVCEALVMLLSGEEAKGLCPFALTRVGVGPFDPEQPARLAQCRALDAPPFACTRYAFRGSEEDECDRSIARALGIQR